MKLALSSCALSRSYTTCSHSAWPMPWMAPPSICPCTICGLTMRPMSLTLA
jgi:hypothetical protein